ncbi:MAG: hypothetical protein WCT10_04130 [Patescibacteria group bacterium]|jgi:hypothetical protein
MSRRTRIILIIAALLLLVGAIIAYLLLQPRGSAGVTALPDDGATDINRQLGGSLDRTTGANVNAAAPSQPAADATTPVVPAVPDESAALKRLAAAFAERFGSFSNQSGYENILDLRSFMSPAMIKWADKYVADATAAGAVRAEYFGMVTRSVSSEVLKLDETAGIAKIAVTTQRREIAPNGGEKLYYQVISIDFVKTDGTWKVDAAKWGDKVNSG